jgi:hypothetical protein
MATISCTAESLPSLKGGALRPSTALSGSREALAPSNVPELADLQIRLLRVIRSVRPVAYFQSGSQERSHTESLAGIKAGSLVALTSGATPNNLAPRLQAAKER